MTEHGSSLRKWGWVGAYFLFIALGDIGSWLGWGSKPPVQDVVEFSTLFLLLAIADR
jgi:hypothetical protein